MTIGNEAPYAATEHGVRLAVRLTPRAAHNRVDGIILGTDGRAMLQLRLTAPPVEGAANKALIAFLAELLHLRKADITIRSGETARLKILDLAGDSAALLARLDALVGKP
jgi:uncharacterized protein (TIGR00251 family)